MRLLILLAALWGSRYNQTETPGPHGMVPGHYQIGLVRGVDRWLLRQAVFQGYLTRPPGMEFHHPDYRRPFYGVWLTPYQHWKVHHGLMGCPTPHDYTEEILKEVFYERITSGGLCLRNGALVSRR